MGCVTWSGPTADDAGEAHLGSSRRWCGRRTLVATVPARGVPGQGRGRRTSLLQASAGRPPGPTLPHVEVPDDGPGRRSARVTPHRGARFAGDPGRSLVASPEVG